MGKIQFKNVNKIYPNGFHAIHDFNLTIDEGEFIVFVGPLRVRQIHGSPNAGRSGANQFGRSNPGWKSR